MSGRTHGRTCDDLPKRRAVLELAPRASLWRPSLALLFLLALLLLPAGQGLGAGAAPGSPAHPPAVAAGLPAAGPTRTSAPRTLSSSGWANVTTPAYPHTTLPPVASLTDGAQHLAYDAADQESVYFGDRSTWVYTSTGWANDTIGTTAPPVTQGYAMAYDPLDGYVLLFGGCCVAPQFYPQQSTWEFVAGTWTNITSAVGAAPPSRENATLTWDGAMNEMLLVGGQAQYACGQATPCRRDLNETWTYAAGVWKNITSTAGSPPGRLQTGSSVAYDAEDGYVLWVGSKLYGDIETWAFIAGTWQNLTATAGAVPAREFGTLGAGPQYGFTILFGGITCHSSPCYQTSLNDSWRFLSGTWLNLTSGLLSPPMARYAAEMDYDASQGYDLLFGGNSCVAGTCWLHNDTWEFSFAIHVPTPVGSPPSGRVDVNEPATFSVQAFGGTGRYSYQWLNLPRGCSAADTSSISCTPTIAGTYSTNVTVTDTNGAHAVSANLTYTVNAVPSIASFTVSPKSVTEPGSVTLSTTVTGGTTPFTYQYAGLPAGCSSTNASTLTCVPTAIGLFEPYVTVTDAWKETASTSVVLWVNPPPLFVSVPTASPSPDLLDVHDTITLSTTVTGGTGKNYYDWLGLPSGCQDANAASLTCTPNVAGEFNVSVQVSSNSTTVTSGNLSLFIHPTLVMDRFTASLGLLSTGDATLLTLYVSGGTTPYSFQFTGLPPGCATIDQANDTCVPTAAGSYRVTGTVTDAAGNSTSASVTLVVNGLNYLNIATPVSSPPGPDVDVGVDLTFTTEAGGGDGGYAYAWSGLPGGCVSANEPRLNCTPTVPGSAGVQVTVTDAAGNSTTSGALELRIEPLPSVSAPSFSPQPTYLHDLVTFNVTVSGGTAPFTYSWSGLPEGCTPAGASQFTCTPPDTGNYTVGILVRDADGRSAQANATLWVHPAPAPSSHASSSSSVLTTPELLGLVVAIVAVVGILAAWLVSRRKSGGGKKGEEDEAETPAKAQKPSGRTARSKTKEKPKADWDETSNGGSSVPSKGKSSAAESPVETED